MKEANENTLQSEMNGLIEAYKKDNDAITLLVGFKRVSRHALSINATRCIQQSLETIASIWEDDGRQNLVTMFFYGIFKDPLKDQLWPLVPIDAREEVEGLYG